MEKSKRGFHSAFTVFEPSGSGALGDPGRALSGIGLRDKHPAGLPESVSKNLLRHLLRRLRGNSSVATRQNDGKLKRKGWRFQLPLFQVAQLGFPAPLNSSHPISILARVAETVNGWSLATKDASTIARSLLHNVRNGSGEFIVAQVARELKGKK